MVHFMDSFEKWTDSTNLLGKWNLPAKNIKTTTEIFRTGTRSLELRVGSGQNRLIKTLPGRQPKTISVAAAVYYIPRSIGTTESIFEFGNWEHYTYQNLTRHVASRLKIRKNGSLYVQLGCDPGSITFEQFSETSDFGVTIKPHKWYHLGFEVEYFIGVGNPNPITVTAHAYVDEKKYTTAVTSNGSVYYSHSNIGGVEDLYGLPRTLTLGTPITDKERQGFSALGSPVEYFYYDDLYVSDTFEGDLGIDVINPMRNVVTGWTPILNTNWEDVYGAVHKRQPYIYRNKFEASTDKWDMEDISGNRPIKAVQGVFIGKKEFSALGSISSIFNNDNPNKKKYFDNSPLVATDCRDNYKEPEAEPGQPIIPAIPWTTENINSTVFGVVGEP